MTERVAEEYDSPLERLELLAGDDEAIASFLDEIDVRSPREREMLAELARTTTLARPERFNHDHRRVVAALESLRRHGFRGSRVSSRMGPLRAVARWAIELVARYIVVSYVKTMATELRNLYVLREIQSEGASNEQQLLRAARIDAEALVEITRAREIGVPAFVVGGLVIPLVATVYRLGTGVAVEHWLNAVVTGIVGALVGFAISWVLLRGTAMASRRIRLSTREPLHALWATVGHCGRPPRDRSRTFAVVSISLTVGIWFILPTLVTISLVS